MSEVAPNRSSPLRHATSAYFRHWPHSLSSQPSRRLEKGMYSVVPPKFLAVSDLFHLLKGRLPWVNGSRKDRK